MTIPFINHGIPASEAAGPFAERVVLTGPGPQNFLDITFPASANFAMYSVVGIDANGVAALARPATGTLSASAAALGTNTGNGTFGTITVAAPAVPGVYTLTFIEPGANAGNFIVEDPNGAQIGDGTVGSAFSAGGLGFTLADGATDFVAGDSFAITVSAATVEVKTLGILTQAVVTASGVTGKMAKVAIDGTWNPLALTWHASVDDAAKREATIRNVSDARVRLFLKAAA